MSAFTFEIDKFYNRTDITWRGTYTSGACTTLGTRVKLLQPQSGLLEKYAPAFQKYDDIHVCSVRELIELVSSDKISLDIMMQQINGKKYRYRSALKKINPEALRAVYNLEIVELENDEYLIMEHSRNTIDELCYVLELVQFHAVDQN